MSTHNPLLRWLNKSILPQETDRTTKHGFFAELYPDGQLKLFTHCFNGSSEHSWRLELDYAVETGSARSGSQMHSAYETYHAGYANYGDGWNDDPPSAVDFEDWVRGWIAKIVEHQLAARARDADDEARFAIWREPLKKAPAETVQRNRNNLVQSPFKSKEQPAPPTKPARLTRDFVCPRCSAASLERCYALELDSDGWDEEQIQLYRCDACTLHGIAWYEESRRGGGESWNHTGFEVSKNYWKSIADWIKDCPNSRNKKCKCASHAWLKEQGKFPGLSQHAEWFKIRRSR